MQWNSFIVRLREPVESSGEKGDLIKPMLSSLDQADCLSGREFARSRLSPLAGQGLSEPVEGRSSVNLPSLHHKALRVSLLTVTEGQL